MNSVTFQCIFLIGACPQSLKNKRLINIYIKMRLFHKNLILCVLLSVKSRPQVRSGRGVECDDAGVNPVLLASFCIYFSDYKDL